MEHELTVERVAQVDLVPERVAQLDTDKLAVPGPLHVLFAVAVGVRVRLEGELSPDGIFSCKDTKVCLGWTEDQNRAGDPVVSLSYLKRSRSLAGRLTK